MQKARRRSTGAVVFSSTNHRAKLGHVEAQPLSRRTQLSETRTAESLHTFLSFTLSNHAPGAAPANHRRAGQSTCAVQSSAGRCRCRPSSFPLRARSACAARSPVEGAGSVTSATASAWLRPDVVRVMDLVGIAEIAYRTDLAEQAWLEAIVHAVAPLLDFGGGIGAAVIDVEPLDRDATPKVEAFSAIDFSQDTLAAFDQITVAPADNSLRKRFARAGSVSTMSRTLGPLFRGKTGFGAILRRNGISDCNYLLIGDLRGRMCTFASPNPTQDKLTRQARARLTCVAAHIHSGFRLRAAPVAIDEAIVDPTGKLQHAEGCASNSHTRESLRRAVRALERARGPLRHRDADAALTLWRALVEGRWSLVDHFDSDGRRFVMARVNPWPMPAHVRLSEREICVSELVVRGYSNKLIAYELGLSAATVATHLSRAFAKLGVRTRLELLALFPRGLGSDDESQGEFGS